MRAHWILTAPHSVFIAYFLDRRAAHRDLHSFPTRRSSDLETQILAGRHTDREVNGLEPVSHDAQPMRARGDRHAGLGRIGCASRSESTRLNSSHVSISYAVFCLKKKKTKNDRWKNTIVVRR